MSDSTNKLNEFAKMHGAKKEFWDEDLKFKYQSKSLREYTATGSRIRASRSRHSPVKRFMFNGAFRYPG
jgi:hypothetical protein